jgi:hypothetical protein
MPNTTNKRMQRKGFYLTLRDITCDCGRPATRQVQVAQFNANGNDLVNVLPLCDDCYALMIQEDRVLAAA